MLLSEQILEGHISNFYFIFFFFFDYVLSYFVIL